MSLLLDLVNRCHFAEGKTPAWLHALHKNEYEPFDTFYLVFEKPL